MNSSFQSRCAVCIEWKCQLISGGSHERWNILAASLALHHQYRWLWIFMMSGCTLNVSLCFYSSPEFRNSLYALVLIPCCIAKDCFDWVHVNVIPANLGTLKIKRLEQLCSSYVIRRKRITVLGCKRKKKNDALSWWTLFGRFDGLWGVQSRESAGM